MWFDENINNNYKNKSKCLITIFCSVSCSLRFNAWWVRERKRVGVHNTVLQKERSNREKE